MTPGDSGGPLVVPLRLDPVADAATRARDYVRDVLHELGRDDLLECGLIGVSELVTNACLHARTPVTVSVVVASTDGRVRIEVSDSSPVLPTQRRHARWSTTGRGLRLLASAGDWGVAGGSNGKTVWFEPAGELDEQAYEIDLDDEDISLP